MAQIYEPWHLLPFPDSSIRESDAVTLDSKVRTQHCCIRLRVFVNVVNVSMQTHKRSVPKSSGSVILPSTLQYTVHRRTVTIR